MSCALSSTRTIPVSILVSIYLLFSMNKFKHRFDVCIYFVCTIFTDVWIIVQLEFYTYIMELVTDQMYFQLLNGSTICLLKCFSGDHSVDFSTFLILNYYTSLYMYDTIITEQIPGSGITELKSHQYCRFL
jgi:hypothetical protein